MAVDIWVSGRVVAAIGVLKTTAAGRWVVVDWCTSSGRRAVAATVVIIVIAAGWRWASVTVSITARAVSTATIGILITGLVGATRAWGARSSSAVTGNVLQEMLVMLTMTVVAATEYMPKHTFSVMMTEKMAVCAGCQVDSIVDSGIA